MSPDRAGAPDDRVVLVTGLAGAGRTTCLKVLEDLGYEAVDNLPITLLDRVLRIDEAGSGRLALGIDSRTRGLDPPVLATHWERLRQPWSGRSTLLFLDCDDDVLVRRFSETRRRHPFGEIAEITTAIREERGFLAPLRDAADLVVDTSQLALPDLRRLLDAHFGAPAGHLKTSVVSFSFKRGLPREADLLFDLRFLRNPHYDPVLRPLTGLDRRVHDHVLADPDAARFLDDLLRLLAPLLPRYAQEGKSYLTVAIGCTGGRHRSVAVAEWLGARLAQSGVDTTIRHRDLPVQDPRDGGSGERR